MREKNEAFSEAYSKKSEEARVLAARLSEHRVVVQEQQEQIVHLKQRPEPATSADRGDEGVHRQVAELMSENQALRAKVEGLQAAVEMAESVASSEAFGSELKWTEELDKLEAELAELRMASELAAQKSEEEILGLLADNTAFKQEVLELERRREEDAETLALEEERAGRLQHALTESKTTAQELQRSLTALSSTTSSLESDMKHTLDSTRSDQQSALLSCQAECQAFKERAEKAELALSRVKFDFEEKDTENNSILQDLIKSRLEFAQLSSDVDESQRKFLSMEHELYARDEEIQRLESELQAARKKKLF